MSRQQSSQLPSVFQNVGFPSTFAPLSQSIPDLMYRGTAGAFPVGSTSATGHPLFIPGLFSASNASQNMLPSPVANHLYNDMLGAASMFYGAPQNHTTGVPVSNCLESGLQLHQSQYPLLPMLGGSPVLSASGVLQQPHLQNFHNTNVENTIAAINHYSGSPVAHQSPTTSSLSSLSVEAKHSDKSPYSVQQPGSHGDTGNGSMTGNSPLNMSPAASVAFRQRVNSSNRTPSLTGASPQASTSSPSVDSVAVSKKLTSPKSLNLHNINTNNNSNNNNNNNNNSSSLSNFSASQSFAHMNSSRQLNANNNTSSVVLTTGAHFDPSELESNGFFTHNVDPSLTTAVDEALSVLGKDVNLDLDAIAPNVVVNQQFWEDLGDSVLDDALLGSSTSVDDSSLVGTSLLHSVFEFNSLNNTSFDDMVSPGNAGPSCSFVEPIPPNASPHQPTTANASLSSSSSGDASMTPKLKEKMKRKEREIAEIDRAFARHLNMVAEKNERTSSSSDLCKTKNALTLSAYTGSQAVGECSAEEAGSAFACYSSDLYFMAPMASATVTDVAISSKFDGDDSRCTVSPVRFSPVPDFDDRDNNDAFPTKPTGSLSSFLCIPNDEFDVPPDQFPSTSSSALTNNDLLNAPAKWTPRKSKKIPIYKQNCVANKTKPASTSKKSHQTLDSPYSFTDEEEEDDVSQCGQNAVAAAAAATATTFVTPKRELTPNAGENVKEKLVEEEVQRKLLQISSLHPELRLDTTKDNINVKTKHSSGIAKSNFQNYCAATGINRQNSAPTNDDLLRHVVPKKRLSASSRGAVSCTDMTPKSSLLNLHNAPGVNSTSAVTSPRSRIACTISSCIASVSGVSNSHKIDAFVKTEIIPDTETAKPSTLIGSGFHNETVTKHFTDPTTASNNNNNNDSSRGQSRLSCTVKPLEPLKPKLIIRIPKQCLTNINLEKPASGCNVGESNNVFDNESSEHSHRRHKRKHKHKKKHKKHKHNSEDGKKKNRKKRHNNDDALPGIKLTMENGVFSLKKRKITGSVSDECRSSFSGDESLISPTKASHGHLNRESGEKSAEDVQSTKNCKKMRWLHAQSATNPGASNVAVDGPSSVSAFPLNGVLTDSEDGVLKPLLSQMAVFHKGAFVVCKEDITKTNCPLWKVDSQNLLQKFLPIIRDGKTVYQGSSTYAGWCVQNQDLYVSVQVKLLHFNRSECLVELESPLLDLFPAVSTEISDNMEVATSLSSNDQETVSDVQELNHPLKEALQTYIQVLVLHGVLGNYLQSLRQRSDVDLIKQLNEVDIINFEKKKKISKEVKWTNKFEEALEWYPYCTVNEDDGSGLHCQACERNVVENVLQLFANEGYDFDTLEPRPPKTTLSGSPLPSQDFHVCPSCADVAVLYHKLAHMRYHLFKKCIEKVDIIRGDARSMDATATVEQCLKHRNWIVSALQEYLNIWSKIS